MDDAGFAETVAEGIRKAKSRTIIDLLLQPASNALLHRFLPDTSENRDPLLHPLVANAQQYDKGKLPAAELIALFQRALPLLIEFTKEYRPGAVMEAEQYNNLRDFLKVGMQNFLEVVPPEIGTGTRVQTK